MSKLNDERPYTTEGSKAWVEWLIKYRGHDYADKYTKDIYLPHAFSSSTLSYSVTKQVNVKLEKEEFVPTEKMTVGEAIDLWLKSKLSSGYATDPEIRLDIPFAWRSLPYRNILVIGHPDAVNLFTKNLLEFKTSVGARASGKIQDYQAKQVAFYWYVIKEQLGIDCDCRVVKIWSNGADGGTSEWTLQPKEKISFANQFIEDAISAARILDGEYQKPDIAKEVKDRIDVAWREAEDLLPVGSP